VHLLPARPVLPGADHPRHQHADLLDHLLRDGRAVFLLVGAAALPPGDPAAGLAGVYPDDGGAALNNSVLVRQFIGDDDVLRADAGGPLFYLGLILFAVGALIICFMFLGTLVIAKEEKTYDGSIPLVTFGGLTACIIAIFTIASVPSS
jgi:hypothetical protein